MSLLILTRVGLPPPSSASPPVRLCLANINAAAPPTVRSHFALPISTWKGESQMARWSSRTFLTKWLSSDGAGFACGVGDGEGIADGDGCGAGETCAEAQTDANTIKTKAKATQRALAFEMPLYMMSLRFGSRSDEDSLSGRLREDYYKRAR